MEVSGREYKIGCVNVFCNKMCVPVKNISIFYGEKPLPTCKECGNILTVIGKWEGKNNAD